ncbi:MAG: hypothetical protein WCO75_06610 [Planctomycetota bacterium]
MTPPARPALEPAPAQVVDIGALWKCILDLAQASPRDQATVDSFTPISWTDGLLAVRCAPGAGTSGTAISDMLASLATRAAGRTVRVRVDADTTTPRRMETAAAPSLRDDPTVRHPLVLEVSALFDATIVRVEAAGTLPTTATVDASEADDRALDADAIDHITHGDLDV